MYTHTNDKLPRRAKRCGKIFRAKEPMKRGKCVNYIKEETKRLREKYASTELATKDLLSVQAWVDESTDLCEKFFRY